MILVSFVYAPKKVQITIKLETISEYACTNQIQKFQLTLWAKVNPLFPNDYLWCRDGKLSIDWAQHLALDWQYTTEQFAHHNEDIVKSYAHCHNASHMMALCVASLKPFRPKSGSASKHTHICSIHHACSPKWTQNIDVPLARPKPHSINICMNYLI